MLNLAQLLRWFSSDFTAAILVDKNKIFLRCELNSLSCKVCKKNCVDGGTQRLFSVKELYEGANIFLRFLKLEKG